MHNPNDRNFIVPGDYSHTAWEMAAESRVNAGGTAVVIQADRSHLFVNSGDTTLHQIDIDASPNIQTNLA
jgi:hypothetical protein